MAQADLAQRIARLEAIEAIKQLKARYCAYCDDNYDPEGIGSLFVEDGIWDGATGRAAIEARLAAHIPVGDEGPRRIHFLSNIRITIDGAIAHALSNWLVIRASAAGAMVGAAGTYDDDLVKRDGRWRFLRRRISEDIAGDLGLKR
jgi:SnoaL-like domain